MAMIERKATIRDLTPYAHAYSELPMRVRDSCGTYTKREYSLCATGSLPARGSRRALADESPVAPAARLDTAPLPVPATENRFRDQAFPLPRQGLEE